MIGSRPGLRVRLQEAVLEVVIDRPEARNALTPTLIADLIDFLAEVARTPTVRAVVLTGAGNRAFCSGFDLQHIDSIGTDHVGAEGAMAERLANAVEDLPVPVIAAVNGAAVGGGCDLAVACDLRVGHEGARFGMPPARLGLLYGWRGTRRLVRLVGPSVAKELLLTGELMDGSRAHHAGLLNILTAAPDVLAAARRLAEIIAANAPLSVRATKRMIEVVPLVGEPSSAVLEELETLQARVWTSHDASTGTRAIRTGEQPEFLGR